MISVGLVGCGDFGRRQHLARLLLPSPRVRVTAVCDVDETHLLAAAELVREAGQPRPALHADFRDLVTRADVDAVLVATPDHWHALVSVAALEAGKDVYCEKPLSFSIAEGRAIAAAARRHGRVFQTGSQQRSDAWYFGRAYELVHRGAIGRVRGVALHVGGTPAGTWSRPRTPPPTLDWNAWLGPAPWADYTPDRCHYSFRWYGDYSGGTLTDHGAHQCDIAQWILGTDTSGPTIVSGTGTFRTDQPHDVPLGFDVVFTYGLHGDATVRLTSERSPRGGQVEIEGTDGWLSVSRRRLTASDPGLLDTADDRGAADAAGAADTLYRERLTTSYRRHHDDWLDAIERRRDGGPAGGTRCDAETGHRAASLCHLATIAIRLGRPLRWDPVVEEFVDDAPANRLLARPMRGAWSL
jgi:predicted dehydrogenase